MSGIFPNQNYGAHIAKHQSLPVFEAIEFDFFRCIPFIDSFYGKTMIELHSGNLRMNKTGNRYSNIFPGQKVSYWSDSPQTAQAEYYHWNKSKNHITFWTYDDGSSSIPTIYPPGPLHIIDGRDMGINQIIKKRNEGIVLTPSEQSIIDEIAYEFPDCLAYESEQRKGGINYLFFEQGFKRLSLRQVSLRLGDEPGKNHNKIICADGSDYTPCLKGYCGTFLPKAKVKYTDLEANTAENDFIRMKLQVIQDWAKRR